MIEIDKRELQAMLEQAALRGANHAIDHLVTYSLGDAAKRLGISYPTLQRRIHGGKIRAVDGRITGAEIRRYLTEKRGNL